MTNVNTILSAFKLFEDWLISSENLMEIFYKYKWIKPKKKNTQTIKPKRFQNEILP
jgi:hypothetical protein